MRRKLTLPRANLFVTTRPSLTVCGRQSPWAYGAKPGWSVFITCTCGQQPAKVPRVSHVGITPAHSRGVIEEKSLSQQLQSEVPESELSTSHPSQSGPAPAIQRTMLQPTSGTQRGDFDVNRLRAPACAPGPALSWPRPSLHLHVCVYAPVSMCVCVSVRACVCVCMHVCACVRAHPCRPADVGRGPVPRGLVLDPCPTCTPTGDASAPRAWLTLSRWRGTFRPCETGCIQGQGENAMHSEKQVLLRTLKQRPVWGEGGRALVAPPGGRSGGRRGGSWLQGTVSADSGGALQRRGHTCLPPPLRFHCSLAIMHLSLRPPNPKAALRDHVPGSPLGGWGA